MMSRSILILGGLATLVGGLVGAGLGFTSKLVPEGDVVSARNVPPRIERVLDTGSAVNGVVALRALGYGAPPPAPPKPPPPPRVVYRPPPPPPPPDIADVFRRSVVAIEQRREGVVLVVRGSLDASPRTLRLGDTFQDGWVIVSLSAAESALAKGKDRRTIRLFAPPTRSAGVL